MKSSSLKKSLLLTTFACALMLGACGEDDATKTAAEETAIPTQEQTAVQTTQESVAAAVEQVATEQAVPVMVTSASSFATASDATNAAVVFSVENPSDMPDKILSAKTTVASSVEFHETAVSEDGVAQMRKIDSIELPAKSPVALSPTGIHVMLLGLAAPLQAGQTFDVALTFEKSPDVVVSVAVQAPQAGEAPAATHDHH